MLAALLLLHVAIRGVQSSPHSACGFTQRVITVLPTRHKLSSSEAFKTTIRKGKRAGGGTVVVHVLLPSNDQIEAYAPRFGLVVSKAVGNAVIRHAVSRKLRHILYGLAPEVPHGTMVVVRALPQAASKSMKELTADVHRVYRKALRR